MAERIAVWLVILRSRIRSQTQYRTSFSLNLLSAGLSQGTELVAIVCLFAQVDALGGFDRSEVLTIYALSSTAFGICEFFGGSLNMLPTYIRTGTFDILMMRPLSVLGQLLTSEVQLHRAGRAVVGVLVLGYVVGATGVPMTGQNILLLLITPLAGALVIGAVWLVSSSMSFWLIKGEEVTVSVTYGTNLLTSYPMTVFSAPVRVVFSCIVPAAFVAYYPALALVDRPDPLGAPEYFAWSGPVVAGVSLAVAAGVWRWGIHQYKGVGS
ncbi:ABC-2 family transporter protein [Streptomyces anulatus]|uniref:ABC transporter permease n=1 Tax=Streptomyces anulatus TaxID=1892 RepID=UPI0033D090F5